jgi:hypothetical protein
MSPWRNAFLAQARSDFEAAGALAERAGHTSQATMLLRRYVQALGGELDLVLTLKTGHRMRLDI